MTQPNGNEHDVVPLLSGILSDVGKLASQQLSLAKAEIGREVAKARDSVIAAALGVATGVLSLVFICIAAAWALVRAIGGLPAWGGFAIVGTILALAAALLVSRAKRRASSIDLVPRQAVEAGKETVRTISGAME